MRFDTWKEKELYDTVVALVDAYVKNKGTKQQFIASITPGVELPWYWKKALSTLDMIKNEENDK